MIIDDFNIQGAIAFQVYPIEERKPPLYSSSSISRITSRSLCDGVERTM